MADHNELGTKGEKLAIDFLIKNGYQILEKNYRYLKAEVDIIAKKENVWLYPVGIISVLLWIYLCWIGKLFGQSVINLFFF